MLLLNPRTALLLLACAVALVTLLAASPAAHAATTKCDTRKDGAKLGATFVTGLTATKISCTKAKQLTKAFNSCRHAHGGKKGKCTSFSGYRCTETRQTIPVELSARATCRASGGRALWIEYTERT
jgi:hypothetical protein